MEGESRREEGRVHARKAPPTGGGEMGEEATRVQPGTLSGERNGVSCAEIH